MPGSSFACSLLCVGNRHVKFKCQSVVGNRTKEARHRPEERNNGSLPHSDCIKKHRWSASYRLPGKQIGLQFIKPAGKGHGQFFLVECRLQSVRDFYRFLHQRTHRFQKFCRVGCLQEKPGSGFRVRPHIIPEGQISHSAMGVHKISIRIPHLPDSLPGLFVCPAGSGKICPHS